jgi:hypothetical protein
MKQTLALLAAAAIVGPGCSALTSSNDSFFASTVSGLEPLRNGFHYEGWAMINGSPQSFGKFNINSAGAIEDLSGNVLSGFSLGDEFANATKLIITIEPAGDTDTIPAETKILAGDVTGGSASLTLADGAALGTSFSSAAGSFILATPTAADPMANPLSGVWFLSMPGPMPSLTLPTLPAGWRYEGWAVVGGQPISTGTFTSPSGADSFSGYSGPNGGPPFPGEDLLMGAPAGVTFPTNLVGAPIVISVEPSPDDSPAPFTMKPLVGTAPAGTMPETPVTMNNNAAASSPTMTVQIC